MATCEEPGCRKRANYLLSNPFTVEDQHICHGCVVKRMGDVKKVALFIDYSRKHHPRRYIPIRSEQDLDEISRMGEWAQTRGKNMVHFIVYHTWQHKLRAGYYAGGFNFGHENSLEFLGRCVDGLRAWLAMSGVTKEIPAEVRTQAQATLEGWMLG